MVDVLRLEAFDRQTKKKVDESLFAVIHKERNGNKSTTFMISLQFVGGIVEKPLLIFSSWRFSISNVIKDHVGLFISDEPNMIFILQFSPFEDDAAITFRADAFRQRSRRMDPISDSELVSRAFRYKLGIYLRRFEKSCGEFALSVR